MSSIQDDEKLVVEGRKKLPDIEAPLRDQIDKKLFKKLEEDQFPQRVVELWAQAQGERAERLQRRQAYLSDWDQFHEANAEGPYQGTSNLHIPVSFTVVKTYHARILQALLGNLPAPKARRADSVDREKLVAETMTYAVKDWANEYEGIETALDSWVWEWCAYGLGVLKTRWECKYEKFVDVVKVEELDTEFTVDQAGNEVAVPVVRSKEVEQERVLKVFEGPCSEFVPEEDLTIIGPNNDAQTADLVAHSQWLTASELWTLVDRGVFDEDAVKKIIKGGDNSKADDLAGSIKLQKDQLSGQNQTDTTTDKDRYQILEVYTSVDVDGDGVDSELVLWVHPDLRVMTRATYLRRVNKAGKRPFFPAEFHRRPGAKHPMGLIEILYPLAKEMDAIHNIRIDSGIISTMPFGFYRASSSLKPETIRYEPGSLIPVDDPQRDVYFPVLGNRTTFGLQEEAAIQNMIERLTGVSDLTLGVMNGNQGATRTATGVRGLIGEANANIDVHLKRLFRAWRQYLKHLLSLLQQRIPPGLSFRVTGDDGSAYWNYIQAQEQLAGDFDFEIDPSSADSNPQVREDKAMQIFNMVMNPLLIQIGVVNPRNVFEAAKGVLVAKNIKEWSRYLQEPPKDLIVMTPQEEVNRLLRGIQVPVSMNADHQGYLEYFQYIMKTPELLGSFSEGAVVALAQQAKKHEEMAAAMQQMQAQAANSMQMRQNAAMSQQQAPVGMNPMSQPGVA